MIELFWSWVINRSNNHPNFNHLSWGGSWGQCGLCPPEPRCDVCLALCLSNYVHQVSKSVFNFVFSLKIWCAAGFKSTWWCHTSAQVSLGRGWLKPIPKNCLLRDSFQQSGHCNTQEVYEKNLEVVSGDFPGYSKTQLCQTGLC